MPQITDSLSSMNVRIDDDSGPERDSGDRTMTSRMDAQVWENRNIASDDADWNATTSDSEHHQHR